VIERDGMGSGRWMSDTSFPSRTWQMVTCAIWVRRGCSVEEERNRPTHPKNDSPVAIQKDVDRWRLTLAQ